VPGFNRTKGERGSMAYKKEIDGMHYEGNCIRPPSEADSILIQVTLGCSHNKCTFCGTFKDKRFAIKDNDTILNDILFASRYMQGQSRVFLMDGDALIIPQKRLAWILDRINEHLPWVKRVGAYANTKGINMKSPDELKELREKGLGILFMGVETGDDETRKKVRKGSVSSHCIEMGRKVKDADIRLSVTVLLGVAGAERSIDHARATGELLSKMDPDFIGALTVMVMPGTPLWEEYRKGEFQMPDELGLLKELREMILSTNITRGLFFSNHASNYLPVKARLPRGKQDALALIDSALRGEIGLKPEWMRAL
jgi:radical SAM superfamily enzyme YgiQ (UPF0313 family)